MTSKLLSDNTRLTFRHAGNPFGVTNEEVISAVMEHLTEQDNAMPSIHNHMALSYLNMALDHLKRRHDEVRRAKEQKEHGEGSAS